MKDPRGQRPPRVVWKAEDRDASGVAYGPVWIDTFDADGKVSQRLFPKRMPTFLAVLGVLVVLGVLGLGSYLASAADVLIWLVEAGVIVAIVRVIWRRLAGRLR
jgi:hypothetical protein